MQLAYAAQMSGSTVHYMCQGQQGQLQLSSALLAYWQYYESTIGCMSISTTSGLADTCAIDKAQIKAAAAADTTLLKRVGTFQVSGSPQSD